MATITGIRAQAAAGASAPTKSDTSSTHQYTCNTCQVAFRFADTQKGHMKSDWHRYNLKRRVASLPPTASDVFTEKVLQARAATTAETDRAEFQQVCEACQKNYFSENAYRNHLGSQKHKAKEAAMTCRGLGGIPDDVSSTISSTFSLGESLPTKKDDIDSEAEEDFKGVVEGLQKTKLVELASPVKRPSQPGPPASVQHRHVQTLSDASSASSKAAMPGTAPPAPNLTLKSCLFCNYDSPTVPLNFVHMERIHGMFVPEKQYLVDIEGLLKFLQQRIQEYCECLYCGKMKSNAYAVQTHMRDKGHCKIPFTTEEEQLEIGDYYDFRSTYSDGGESDGEHSDGDQESGGAKLGAKRFTTEAGENADNITDDDAGWETDSSASSCASDEITSVPIDQHHHLYERLDKHPHHSSYDPRHHHKKDGWHSHAHKHRAVFYDDTELHLPSGRSVGHRSLVKYYKQNLHNHPSAEERAERHAIQSANSGSVGAYDDTTHAGGRQVAYRERGRQMAVANRETGMAGVTDAKKNEVRRAELRARKREGNAQKRKQWALNKQGNFQKHHNYQIL